MANIISIPIMVLLLMLQTGIISHLPLLKGTADVILLVLIAWSLQEKVTNAWIWAVVGGGLVCLVSATPFFAPLVGYLVVTGMARFLQKRIWQTPILAMLIVTFAGTVVYQGILFVVLVANGVPLDWRESMELVVLPSILLNLALALPILSMIVDLANLVYPSQIET